ncbi:hypothetical protein DOTSEDRAFT_40792 [Dothistroma septosporum NZE10]|uniref:Uncharacterized protein n=1 Tax=Dothistroma septosporum (strain NZE10 / CBS 128990) TaxID=675120 RepID=N1Q4B3_DOTSN|nr:hypothetical protein DOTSEDRAFT_40792 [Dothistroma septosporum NZE10]
MPQACMIRECLQRLSHHKAIHGVTKGMYEMGMPLHSTKGGNEPSRIKTFRSFALCAIEKKTSVKEFSRNACRFPVHAEARKARKAHALRMRMYIHRFVFFLHTHRKSPNAALLFAPWLGHTKTPPPCS